MSEPRSEDEVARLARTLNAMLARVQTSVEQQRRFVADAAHELRSPIASLRTQLETARESRTPVDWQRRSATLLEDTVRMQRLTDQLLLLARLDAAAGSVWRQRPVDLDDVALSVAQRTAVPAGVTLDLSEVRPAQVSGDPILLEQLVANLLDNALRHARGSVRMRVRRDGAAVLQVDDDGLGIPVDGRGEVLRRFARLDSARDRGSGGVGLGLAIAADIVRAHGGTLDVGDSGLGGARPEAHLP